METIDLFDHMDQLPQEVKDIIEEFEENGNTYHNCEIFKERLEEVGYTCDYGLDASPYGLRKLEGPRVKGFVATVEFLDTHEVVSGVIFKVGIFDEENATEEEMLADQNVFYYLQDEEEIEILKTGCGAGDFIVLDAEPLYQI
jgi:hypothetical protein